MQMSYLAEQFADVLPLTILLAGGCGEEPAPLSELDSSSQSVAMYSSRPNGTGIHVGSTQPESWFGLTSLSVTWFLTGFSQHADGTWWATGWYSLGAGVLSAEAQVLRAQLGGVDQRVLQLRTSGSQLSIDLVNSLGAVQTVQGADLAGLILTLRVPDLLGVVYTNYRLRITTVERVDSRWNDVSGYRIDYQQAGLLGGDWSSYCRGAGGESQRAVFYQGAQWHPLNAARSEGNHLVTMTCESGSVARCMSWGYRPWASDGQTTAALDYHQSCIHMKRASYCGDSYAYTTDGTQIIVNDLWSPPINSGPLDNIEALWGPAGATCLSSRRHPEILFLGCPEPLPACPAHPSSGYLIADGLPAAGSLLGLVD